MQRAIWYIGVAQTLLWGALYYLFPALLLQWEDHYGWARTELTLALTIAVIMSAVFAPKAGKLVDQGYDPIMMTTSALLGALFLAILPFVNSLLMFYAVWAAIGVCMAGCLYEACFAFIIRHLEDDAKRAITFVTLLAGFASTICFPACRYLADNFGVNATIQIIAGLIVVLVVPIFWLGAKGLAHHQPANHSTEQTRADTQQDRSFLRSPVFWLLAASFSLLTINHGAVLNHLLPILEERHTPDAVAVLAVSMIGPMQVLGRVIWMLLDRHITTPVLTLTCFAGINLATVCLIISQYNPYWLIGFVALQGASYGVISIVKPLLAREVMGARNFGLISGVMALPYLICFAASPYIGSLLWQWQGYSLTLWIIGAISIAGALCLMLSLSFHYTRKGTAVLSSQPCDC